MHSQMKSKVHKYKIKHYEKEKHKTKNANFKLLLDIKVVLHTSHM